jgi:hypothetical protein
MNVRLPSKVAKVGALLVGLGGAVACGSDALSAFGNAAAQDPNAQADAGGATASESDAPKAPPSAALVPVDNAVILVHAAGLGAFRVCFGAAPKQFPQPDKQTMPEANVVGVDVGTAVRLPPIDTSAKREVYVYEERLLRPYTAPFGSEVYDCETLLGASTESIPKPVATMTLTTNLATGVHLLVLSGCGANPGNPNLARTARQCGADFSPTKGNLKLRDVVLQGAVRDRDTSIPAQVVHLSQPLASARTAAGANAKIEISYGPVVGDAGAVFTTTSIATDPPLLGAASPAAPVALAYDPEALPDYAQRGFRVTLGGKSLLSQSLADVARLSSPNDLPSSYYAAASNYVLLLLGDPEAPVKNDAGADELEKLHFLVVPVVQPKADANDAGT